MKSANNIFLNGMIQNVGGTTTIQNTGSEGSIFRVSDAASIGGRSITLSAIDGIGTDVPLYTNQDTTYLGSLTAVTQNGNINLQEITGDVRLNLVITSQSTGDVSISSQGAILGTNAGTLIRGGRITLASEHGSVGTLGASPQPIYIDTGSTTRDYLYVSSFGDVNLEEFTGDLRLKRIDTNAGKDVTAIDAAGTNFDVRLVVQTGALIDANSTEQLDPRTVAELEALWDRMKATTTTAQDAVNATINAYESTRTNEYHMYWSYRNRQANPAVYDSNFQVTLTAAETTTYTDYYTQVGTDQGLSGAALTTFVTNALTTLSNKRTAEYHTLHKIWGPVGNIQTVSTHDANVYDPNFRYETDAGDKLHGTFGASKVSGNTVTVGLHAFNDGQAVAYFNGGGTSIGGLTHGGTYYVVRVDSTHIRLAGSQSTYNLDPAAKVFADSSIDIGANTFADGQSIVYRSNGGFAVGGLIDGGTYFVRVTGVVGGRIRLAPTQNDALNGTNLITLDKTIATGTTHSIAGTGAVITLDASSMTGSGHYFSEAGVLGQRAAWSESQLKNSLSASILRPKTVSGTTLTVEEANIVGRNINISVAHTTPGNGNIGSILPSMDIDLTNLSALTQQQRLALASAERDDITFYEDLAGTLVMEPDDLTKTARLVRIQQTEDVDVASKGYIQADATGILFLGSEITMRLHTIRAGGDARIKGQVSILDGNSAISNHVNVSANNLVVEGETGSIGSSTDALVIDLKAGAKLTARSGDSIYITEDSTGTHTGDDNNLNFISINALNHLDLRALDGSILDSVNNDNWDILATTGNLEALGSIGESTDYFDVELGGALTATAGGNIYLNEVNQVGKDGGILKADLITSTGGDVFLRAYASIVGVQTGDGASGKPLADVRGNFITLTAGYNNPLTGTVGNFGDDLDIDSSYSSTGGLTSTSVGSTHINETLGNLTLYTVTTGTGQTAFIAALAGSITNGLSSGHNILSGKTYLFASQDIGTLSNPITATVGNLEGKSTAGSSYIRNTGALTVGGVVASADPGFFAGGAIRIQAMSPVTVTENITSATDVEILATDSAGGGDFITVKSGVTVESTGADVRLLAGDNITIESGATVRAAGTLTIHGDYTNADSGVGSVITLNGTLSAATIQIVAESDEDTLTIDIDSPSNSMTGYTSASLGGGNDTLTVNRLHSRTAILDLDGQSGSDTYTINLRGGTTGNRIRVLDSGSDAGDTLTIWGTTSADDFLLRASKFNAPTGTAFVAALHGANVERIDYSKSLESLTVEGQDGDDRFTLDDNWTLTTLRGGIGRDTFQIGQIFQSDRTLAAGLLAVDEMATVRTTRGYLTNGVSYPTTLEGGNNEDTFTIYHNLAVVDLFGNDGDDLFVYRSFSLYADPSQFVLNVDSNVNGGNGVDTLRWIGSEASDKVVISSANVIGAGILANFTQFETMELDAAEGNDAFYVLSTNGFVETKLYGGVGVDTFSIGGDVPLIQSGATTLYPATSGPHTVDNIADRMLTTDGGGGWGSAELATPVMLPGEVNGTSIGFLQSYAGTGNPGATDQVVVSDGDLAAAGISNVNTLINQSLYILSGNGIGRFWLILAVVFDSPGMTRLTLQNPTLTSPTWALPNTSSRFAIQTLPPSYFVNENTSTDTVTVYHDAATGPETSVLTNNRLTGLTMTEGIAYSNLEALNIKLGSGDDTVNVRSTNAGTVTTIESASGNDTFHVSSTAGIGGAGTLDNILGQLILQAGLGAANRLILDDTGSLANPAAEITDTHVLGLAPAEIVYSAVGGSFTNGPANDGILIYGSTNGRDDFNIRSTLAGSTLKILGQGGDDVITVGSAAPGLAGNLDGIAGTLTIDAGDGTANRLIVDDSTAIGVNNVTVTNNSLVGFAPANIFYSATGGNFTNGANNNGILLRGSNTAGDTFHIASTLAGSTTRVDTLGGNDLVTVSSDAPGVTGNLDDILGTLTVDTGAGTDNRLIVNDFSATSGNSNIDVTDQSIVGFAPANLYYFSTGGALNNGSNRDGIYLRGSNLLNDRFNIVSTLGGSQLKIDSFAGNDFFNVSSDTSAIAGNLDGILGTLTLDAGTGSANRLIVNDVSTASGNNNIVVTNSTLLGFAPADIYYQATGGQFTRPGFDDGILLQGSDLLGDSFDIQSTLVGSTIRIAGLSGNDAFRVGNPGRSLDDIQGQLTLDGGSHAVTPTTLYTCDTHSVTRIDGDTITFDDRLDNGANNYNLTSTTLDRSGWSTTLFYANAETITLNTGLGSGSVTVNSAVSNGVTTIQGNQSPDAVTVNNTGIGSVLRVNTEDGADNVYLRATGANAFTLIDTGNQDDTLIVSSTAGLGTPGNLNGIEGVLCLQAGTGSANHLVIDDTTGAPNASVELTFDHLLGLAPASIYYYATGGNYTHGASNDGIQIFGSDLGDDSFNVFSTLANSTTKILTQAGNDTVKVGNPARSLDEILGRLTIDAGSNLVNPTASFTCDIHSTTRTIGDRILFDDRLDADGNSYRLTSSTLNRSAWTETLTYINAETIQLMGGRGVNSFDIVDTVAWGTTEIVGNESVDRVTVQSTNVGAVLIVSTEASPDTVDLRKTGSAAFTKISTGTEDDFITVSSTAGLGTPGNVDGVAGVVGIDAGTGNSNRLIVDDSTGLGNPGVEVTFDHILGLANGPIYYYAIGGQFNNGTNKDGIRLLGSNVAADRFNIRSTRAGSTTKILTQAGGDYTTIGSVAPGLGGNLHGIVGMLTIDSGAGLSNRLVVDDSGTTYGNTDILVTRDSLLNFAPAPIYYYATGGGHFSNDGKGVWLRGSNKLGDQFTVTSTAKNSNITIETLGGADRINVGSKSGHNNGNLDQIQGRLRILAGANLKGRPDQIYINDRAKKGKANYDIDATHVVNLPVIPGQPAVPARVLFAGIFYDGNAELLRMDGTDDVNIFNVKPSRLTEMYFDGNLPLPGVCMPGGGDYLRLNTAGTMGRRLFITGLGAGRWQFTSGHKYVRFESIERFNHVDILATANADGTRINVYDAETKTRKFTVVPYESHFRGGIQIATGDVNCDGLPDLLVTPMGGRAPTLKIYNGTPNRFGFYQANVIASYNLYSADFLGGVNLAVGDVNGDGANDVIYAPAGKMRPEVNVLDGKKLRTGKKLRPAFLPFPEHFRGGVRVAAGDFNSDGAAEIIVGSGVGITAQVLVFNGKTGALIKKVQPFTTDFKGGVFVNVGDFNGDRRRDLITSSDAENISFMRVYSGATMFRTFVPTATFTITPFPEFLRDGVRVTVRPTDGGDPGAVEKVDIFAATAPVTGRVANLLRRVYFVTLTKKIGIANHLREIGFNGFWLG